MSGEVLTKEQEAFLEECTLEFSERFTDSDLEFKKVYDSEIPPPPIVSPWYGRQRFNRDRGRDQPGGSYNSRQSGRGYTDREPDHYRNNHNVDYKRERHYRPY